jgi:hypothetical protein
MGIDLEAELEGECQKSRWYGISHIVNVGE